MSEPAPPSIALIVVLFVVVFTAMWSGVVFLMSRVSGWSALARVYPGPKGAKPTRYRGRTAYLRFGSRMQGVLCFDADSEGFTAAPIWLFRLGHAPLRIPWSEVTVREESWLLLQFVTLRFRREPGVPMRLPATFGRELLAARVAEVPDPIAPR